MSRQPAPPATRPLAWIALSLALLPALAPWPIAQGLVHGFLIAVLLPLVPDPVVAALAALAAGWLTELTLRLLPHPGGAAWADLSILLFIRMADRLRPPDSRWIYVPRVVGILLLHALLLHAATFLANGTHAWGRVWMWPPLTSLLWAPLFWGFHRAHQKR